MRWVLFVWLAGCGFSSRTGGNVPGDGDPTDAVDAPPDAEADAGPTPAGCKAVAIESMSAQTCVRRNDGEVWCWGRNEDGAIGVASDLAPCTANNACVRVPKKVAVPEAVVRLGLGDRHSCALSATKVYCWGENGHGQLGDNSTTSAASPRVIPLRAGSTQLRGGDVHTCGLHGASVSCSGKNMFGEVGDQSTTERQVPTAAGLAGTVTSIGAGYHHSCAIVGGAVSCWGENTAGQVDTSGNTPVTSPRATGVTTATIVVGGVAHTCTRHEAGTVRCWGRNTAGQLGIGDTNPHNGPQLLGLTGVSQIVAGVDHTCALAGTGVWCWGERYTSAPTQVSLGAPAIAVSAGSYHDCAILMNGTVRCWGMNPYGQLGDGTLTTSTAPVQAVVCP